MGFIDSARARTCEHFFFYESKASAPSEILPKKKKKTVKRETDVLTKNRYTAC